MLNSLRSNTRAVILFLALLAVLMVPVVTTLAIPADPSCNASMIAYPLSKESACNGTFSPNGDGRKDTSFFHVTGTSPGVSAHIIVFDPIDPSKVYARIKLVETTTGTYDSDWDKNVTADDTNEDQVIDVGETGWTGVSTTGKTMPLADGMKFQVGVCGAAWATMDPQTDYRCVDSTSDALVPAVESVSLGTASYISIDNIAPINTTFTFTPDPTSTDVNVTIGYNEPVSYFISSPADTWTPYPPIPASEDPRITVTQQINGSQSVVIDNDTFADQGVQPFDGNILSRGGPSPATNGPVSMDIAFVPGVADGLASVDIRGVDFAGNIALDATTVLVDTIAPTANFGISPAYWCCAATFDNYTSNEFDLTGTIDDNPGQSNAPNDEVVGLGTNVSIVVTRYNDGTGSFDIPVTTLSLPIDFTTSRTGTVNGTFAASIDAAADFGAVCGDIFRLAIIEEDLLGNTEIGNTMDIAIDPTPPTISGLVADAVSSQNTTSVHFEVNIVDPICQANRSGVNGASVNLYTTVPGFEGPIPMSAMSVDGEGNGSYEANFAFTGAADSTTLEDATVDASDNVGNYAATPFVDVFDIDTSAPAFDSPLNLHSNATNSGNWASPDINIYYFTDEVAGASQDTTSWAWSENDISIQVDDVGLEGVLDVTADLSPWGGSATEPMTDEVTAGYDWNHDGDSTDANVYGTQQSVGLVGPPVFDCGINVVTVTARDQANGANVSTYDTEFLYDCAFPTGGIEIPTSASGDLNSYDDGSTVWIGNGDLDPITFTGTASDTESGINTVNAYLLINGATVDTQTDIALDAQTYQSPRSRNGGNEIYPDGTAMPNGEVLTTRWSFTSSALGSAVTGDEVLQRIAVVDNAGLVQFIEQVYTVDNAAPVVSDLLVDPVSSQNATGVHFTVNVDDSPWVGVDPAEVDLYTTVVGYEGPFAMAPIATSVDAQGNGSWDVTVTFTGATDSITPEDATVDASDLLGNRNTMPFADVFDIDTSAPSFVDPLNLHSNAANSGNWASPDINIYYFTDEVPGADQALTSWAHNTVDMSVQVDDVGLEGVLDVTIDLSPWGGSATEPMISEMLAPADWNHDGDAADANVYGTQQLVGGGGPAFDCGLNTATITARDNATGANISTYQTQFLYDCEFPGGSFSSISGDLNTYNDGTFTWIGNGGFTSVIFDGSVSDTFDPENSGINTVNAYVLVNGATVDTQTNLALSNQTYQAPRVLNASADTYPDASAMPSGEVLTGDWSFTTDLSAYASCNGCVVTEKIEVVDNAGLVQYIETDYIIDNLDPSVTNGIHLLDGGMQPADYSNLDLNNYSSDSDNATTDVWYSASADTLAVAITSGPDGVVDTTAAGDDNQLFPATSSIGANEVAITSGANGYIDTAPLNDDVAISVPLDEVILNAPASWGYAPMLMDSESFSGTDWNQNGPLQAEVWGADVGIPHGIPAVTTTGAYSASVEATDVLGNESVFDPITLNVDNEDPTISEPMVLQRDDTGEYYISDQSDVFSSPHDTDAYLSVRVNDPTVSGITSGVLEVSIAIPAADFDGSVGGTDESTLGTDLDRDGDTDTETYQMVDEVTAATDWNESGGLESDVYGIALDANGAALDGLKDFVVTATDKAQYPDGTRGNYRDNTNGGAWIEMIIDSTAPDAALVRPADTEWINTYNPTATFSGIVSDDVTGILDSGIRSLEIMFDDGNGTTSLGFATINVTATQDQRYVFGSNDPTGPVVDITYPDDVLGTAEAIQATWSITTSALFGMPCSGAIDVSAEAIDNAGNAQTLALGNIKLECTQPGLNVAKPENHSYVRTNNTGNMATIDGYANDTLSGVYQVQYSLDSGISWTDVTSSPYPTHPSSVYWYLNWDTTGLPDGTYNFLFRSIDWAQNEQLAGGYVSWSVKLDNTNPTSSISTPVNNTITAADEISVSGSASDSGSGVAMVEVLVDGTPATADGTSNWSYTLDTTSLTDGSHTIQARATDKVGNVQTTLPSKTIYVDNGAPIISSLGASPASVGIGVETITFNATDDVDPTLTVSVMSNGTPLSCSKSGVSYTCTQNINSGSINGTYDVVVTATDRSGNSSTATTSFMVDTTAPMATVMIDQNAPFTNDVDRDVTLSLQDGGSNATQIRVKNEDGVWSSWMAYASSLSWTLTAGDGTKTVFVQVRDAAGNMSAEASDTIVLDQTSSSANITSPIEGSVTSASNIVVMGNASDMTSGVGLVEVSVNGGSFDAAQGTDAWSFTLSGILSGTYSVEVRVTDKAGNICEPCATNGPVSFEVDQNAPEVSIESVTPDPASLGTVTVEVEASDFETEIISLTLTGGGLPLVCSDNGDGTWTCEAEISSTTENGDVQLVATAMDSAGNTATDTDTLTVDTVAPTGTVLINDNDEATDSSSVSLKIEDAAGDMTEVRFKNEDGVWGGWTDSDEGPFDWDLVNDDGQRTVFAQFRDALGNTSGEVSDTIILDTSAPNVNITTPVSGTITNATAIVIGGNADDGSGSGIMKVLVSIDGGGYTEATGQGSWSYAWTTSDGPHTIDAIAIDNAGNTSSVSIVSLTVDTSGPKFTIVPTPSTTGVGAVSIAVTASETLMATPDVTVNGQPATCTTLVGLLYTCSFNVTTGTGTGTATIVASGTDLAGNAGSSSATMTVDVTAPSGSISIESDAVYTAATAVTLSLNATDAGTGVSQMRFRNEGGAWSSYEAYATSKAWVLTSGDGLKTVYVQYKDSVGNESDIASDTITLDETDPTEAITYPLDAANVMVSGAGAEIAIVGTAQDVTSGIANVHVEICNVDTEACEDGDAVGDNSWSFTWTVGSEGTYDISVTATDKAGNSTETDTSMSVIFDGTAPSFANIEVDPFYANMTDASITFTVDEELAADPTVLVNGQPAAKVSGPTYNGGTGLFEYEYSYTVNTGSGEGPATVVINGTDLSGITGTATTQFVIDISDPTGTFDSPGDGGGIGGDPITLSGTAADQFSGIALVEVSIDGADYATADGTDNWSYTWDDPTVGDHSLTVRITDLAGNQTVLDFGFTVTFIDVEDTETDKIVYSGTWESVLDGRLSGGSAVLLEGKNSFAAMNFYGRRIEFVSAKAKVLGKVNVFIDGNLETTIDLYSGSVQAQQTVFTKNFGSLGNHQIAVVATGKKNTRATDSLVAVDKFVIR